MNYYTLNLLPELLRRRMLSQRALKGLTDTAGVPVSLTAINAACTGKPIAARTARGICTALGVTLADVSSTTK